MDDYKHGGDIYRNMITHDFSVNLNPLGMPETVKKALRDSVEHWNRYPDSECGELTARLAEHHQISKENILCGNGAADLIYQLVQAKKPGRALLIAPTFSEYRQALEQVDCRIDTCFLEEKHGFHISMDTLISHLTDKTDLVFFCNPNNPTGIPVKSPEVEKLAKACHHNKTLLVLDECFCEFLEKPEEYSMIGMTETYPYMLILRAFTKSYAMAGVRLGYGISGDKNILEAMKRVRQPWSVSVPAQEAGIAALQTTRYLEHTRELLKEQRLILKERLRQLGLIVYDSEVNYLLFRVPWEQRQRVQRRAADSLYEVCRKQKLLIRDCSNFTGLDQGFYRICIRTPQENQVLLEILTRALEKTKGV